MNSSPGNNSAQDNCHLGPSVGIIIDQGGSCALFRSINLNAERKVSIIRNIFKQTNDHWPAYNSSTYNGSWSNIAIVKTHVTYDDHHDRVL